MKERTIIGAAVGDCVHVAGLLRFLSLAEQCGYRTTFLGPAVSIPDLVGAAIEAAPDMIAVSYRLTPEAASRVFGELQDAVTEAGLDDRVFVLGGTAPVCRAAQGIGLFDAVFDGHSRPDDVIAYLRGGASARTDDDFPRDLIGRILNRAPHPIIRHHFGRPTVSDTERGIAAIAEARVLDVISIGPDQNAQASMFRPGDMDPAQDGAGGVPIRGRDDLERLARAAERGNRPLLRCYSGTRDLIRMAELLEDTIANAWCAVPLCWYSVLDGRSGRAVPDAIAENQQVMRWHGLKGIPVEVNEAHHWSLRDAPDSVAVAMAWLAAYNARAMGVSDYVAQYMFNTPAGTWITADLGKMLAKRDLIESLSGPEFRVWRQTRAGLSSYPADMLVAKGQLASSVQVQMALSPHIVHVVGFSEADHAAEADEVIESCLIARGTMANCLEGLPDATADAEVNRRRAQLTEDARVLLDTIATMGRGIPDPFTDPGHLARAIKVGLIDAPHLVGNPHARGMVRTGIITGRSVAVDDEGRELSERERIASLSI